jgi:hypothetical protein
MKPWLKPLASNVGFHKPDARPPYESDPHRRLGQGGTLVSSPRESVWADKQAPPGRRPAVVGLVAPPYGLPSTDPTTPARSLFHSDRPSSRCSSGSRRWSAHADNSGRSGIPPCTPFPSRQDRPLGRPDCFRTEDLVAGTAVLAPKTLSAAPRAIS